MILGCRDCLEEWIGINEGDECPICGSDDTVYFLELRNELREKSFREDKNNKMNRKELIETFEEIMERGKELLKQEEIKSVDITYCPICDNMEVCIFDGHNTKTIEELDCWGTDHSPRFNQSFSDYHKTSYEIEIILKYEKMNIEVEEE